MGTNIKIHLLNFFFLFLISFHGQADETLIAPEGFKIDVFASEIQNPRQIAQGDDGYFFVGSKAGMVYALKDFDNNGVIDFKTIIADDMSDASGVAFKDGSLYIAEIDKIWKIDQIEEKINNYKASNNIKKVLITDNLPSDEWHGRKWIKIDLDGSILVNVGAPCNVCLNDDQRYASIIRFKEGAWSIEASGVRNSVGFDWNPINGKLYFTDNGRDWMGDMIPSCELNVLEEAGDFFGFPYLHAKNIKDPEFGDRDHGYEIKKPILELGAHVAPTGIEFYKGNSFPETYQNNAFITLHGSWNSSKKVGYKVIRVIFDLDGKIVGVEDFITGFLEGESVSGRPAAPFSTKDGSLLISDDYANKIYKVDYSG